jgi:diguanylate cyclase (GGDEF)-like protein/PAS domain S-box-containing protein
VVISQQIKANVSLQSLLRDRERMLDSLMSSLEGMVYCCLHDAHWTMVFVSQGCQGLTGYPSESLLHNRQISYELLTLEEDRQLVRTRINQAIQLQQQFEIEYRILHADGSIRWVLERGQPVFNAEGEIEFLEGFIQNITPRKRSENELREAKERYYSIFNNAIEGIYQTSPEGSYLNFNPALARIYGYASPEELRHGVSDIQNQLYVEPGKRDEFITLMKERGSVQNFEAQVYRQNGDVIWISENAREVRNAAGELLFYEGTVEDITERKRYQQEIEYQATHDGLTGLPNRVLLLDRLQQCVSFADRYQAKLAVAFIDLDQFKLINDGMGHHVGDQLLVEVSKRLLSGVRESDTLVRLGGDEFVMLMNGVQKMEELSHVMQRILASVSLPFVIDGWDYKISCSIGVSIYPDDGQGPEDLLKHADTAMFKAKQLGRNNVQFYTNELNRSLMERLDIEYRLHQAIGNQEFLLHYQPKVEFSTGRICGAEALIRWQPHGEAMISPMSFIPIAEETGMIKEIGEWVLREACRTAAALSQHHGLRVPIAVNVSPRQFRHLDMVETVQRILDEVGLEPGLLELEITEGTLAHDPGTFIQTLHDLKALGVKIAIDDFGTGYCSMAYLKDFPIDRLKIDKAFVGDLETNAANTAILNAIIGLGHSLGLRVVAEGVETRHQYALLQHIQCDELQGYIFSKPLSPESFKQTLLANAVFQID